ncbi:MAG: hypothetical protein RIQ84_3 [Pseudomonadota bacterium]
MGLSVILITKNEEANLKDCLESISFANEIIIVDSQSTDQTINIAKSYGAKLEITTDWPGFGPQKNRALNLATQDWVLSIDADERVTPELKREILDVIESSASKDCYERGTAKFSDHLVHERLLPNGEVAQLKNHFLHYSFKDFSQVLRKVDVYSTASANEAFKKGKRSSIGKAISHAIWAFFRTYFLRLGFLDGPQGLALAISNAEGTYYRYIKIWLLQQGLDK